MIQSLFEPASAKIDTPRGPIILRDYQRATIDAISEARNRGVSRQLFVLATGLGKTSVFSALIDERRRVDPQMKALVLAHREELLDQAASRIRSMAPGVRVSIEAAARKAPPWSDVVVASVATIGRPSTTRLSWFKPSLVVIDESHHAAADSYQHVMRGFGCYTDEVLTVGCTATPHRMDNRPLHGSEEAIFQELVYSFGILDGIKAGWLTDIRAYAVLSGQSIKHVKTTAGDFNQKELARAVDNEKRNSAAIKHWLEVARDRRTMAFCASVDHAYNLRDMFRGIGISAEAVDGTTPSELRRDIVDRFRRGDFQVLTNMAVFTEGFDCPEIGCILMLRPTQSWTVFVQAVGRGLRPAEGKDDCIVIDVVDQSNKHSLASVPSMIGLPPAINMKGRKLTELHDKVAAAGPKAASLQASCDEAQAQGGLVDFDNIDSVLTSVDLFASLKPTEEVSRNSNLMWLELPSGVLMLSAGKGETGERVARLIPDTLGRYTLKFGEGGPTDVSVEAGDSIGTALEKAERILQSRWPGFTSIASAKARWRGEPPSDRQRDLLVKLGVPHSVIAELDRGSASALITQKIAGRAK